MVDQPRSSSSSGSQVFMMSMPINVATRSKDYKTPTLIAGKDKKDAPSSSTPSSSSPLHIEQPIPDSVIQPPSQGVL